MLREKVKQKKGRNKNKKKEVFLSEFFLVFLEEKKRILKVLSKIVENKTDFFRSKMFLNQENRNRKQKRVFPTCQDKKHILIFWIHQKSRKREIELKRRIKKKKTGHKNEKPFFKTQKKTKHGKKSPREKETEKTKFFCGEKKKNSFAEV